MYSRLIRIKTYQGKVLVREGFYLRGIDKDLLGKGLGREWGVGELSTKDDGITLCTANQ